MNIQNIGTYHLQVKSPTGQRKTTADFHNNQNISNNIKEATKNT
jgi:hypothetical protein